MFLHLYTSSYTYIYSSWKHADRTRILYIVSYYIMSTCLLYWRVYVRAHSAYGQPMSSYSAHLIRRRQSDATTGATHTESSILNIHPPSGPIQLACKPWQTLHAVADYDMWAFERAWGRCGGVVCACGWVRVVSANLNTFHFVHAHWALPFTGTTHTHTHAHRETHIFCGLYAL